MSVWRNTDRGRNGFTDLVHDQILDGGIKNHESRARTAKFDPVTLTERRLLDQRHPVNGRAVGMWHRWRLNFFRPPLRIEINIFYSEQLARSPVIGFKIAEFDGPVAIGDPLPFLKIRSPTGRPAGSWFRRYSAAIRMI